MIDRDYTQKNIKYIKRNEFLSSMRHMQLVVSELDSEYSVIFHDDDILYPDYMVNISSNLSNNKNLVAIECNGMNLKNNVSDPKNLLNSKLRINKLSSPIKFNKEKEFLERFLLGNNSNASFPSYMYRTKYLKEVMLNPLLPHWRTW